MSTLIAGYESVTTARSNFKTVLDRAARGHAVTIRRGTELSVITDAHRLRHYFFSTVSPGAKVFQENERWVVLLENRQFVSEGFTVDAALSDLVESLREYAEDWESRLHLAQNHQHNWALVQLINLSSDEDLVEWIKRGGER